MRPNVKSNLDHFVSGELNFIGIAEDFLVMYGREQNEKVHRHYGYQLLIPTKKLEINGKVIDDQVLIASYVDHIVYGDGEVISLLIKPESDIGRRINECYFQKESIVYFCNQQMAQKVKAFSEAIITAEEMQTLVLLILQQLMLDTSPADKPDHRVTEMINYIKFSDFQELSYQDVMGSVFLSKSRLANLFKKEMGIPVMKYITWQRLVHASEELATSRKTITEVAHQYGFSDAAHFSRVFKENFGTSPKQIFQNKHKTSISFMFL